MSDRDAEWPSEWDVWKKIAYLIEEELDSYADNEHESYYPSIEKELIPKIREILADTRGQPK